MGLDGGQIAVVIAVMKPFLADEMNQILHQVEFWRIFRQVMKNNLNGEQCALLFKQILHFLLVGGVIINEYVCLSVSLLLQMSRQVRQISRYLLGFGFFLGLEKAFPTKEFNGEQAVGAGSFFSSVWKVGRVFFSAQP